MLPIQRGIAQRDRRPVQRFQPPTVGSVGERIVGGEEECLEAGILDGRRGSETARAVLRADIGAQIRHRLAPPFRTGLPAMKSAISGNATKQGRMTITSMPRRE